MSTRYNFFGGLVTDGLVLNLDAAKLQSYSGSGTNWVNLINNSISGGTLINGPTLTGSGKNLAITFDGTNDYTEVLDNSIIDFGTSNFTSNIWIYPSSSLIGNTEYGIINKNNGFQNVTGWGLELSTYDYSTPFPKVDMLGFNSGQSSWGLSTILAPIRTNTWSNVNLMRTGNKFDLYVNGSLSTTKINSNVGLNVDNSVNLTLGKSSTWQQYFKGNISNFNLFNRALSPFDIFQNFNAYKSRYGIPDIVTSGLTLNLDAGNPYSYNPLNTGSTTWVDTTYLTTGGTLTNGVFYSGGTMVFDGVDDWVTVNNTTGNFGTGNFTIDLIFKTTTTLSPRTFFAKSIGDTPTVNYGWLVNQASSGELGFATASVLGSYGDVGTYSIKTNGGQINDGSWKIVSIVGDKLQSNVTIYINGIQQTLQTYVGNNAFSTVGNITNTQTLRVGAESDNSLPYPINSNISLARLYNRALSQAEITQNFNALRGRYGI
jgi:hypothetical protein